MRVLLILFMAVASSALAHNKSWISASGSSFYSQFHDRQSALESAINDARTNLTVNCASIKLGTVVERTIEISDKSCDKRKRQIGDGFTYYCRVTMAAKCAGSTESSGSVINIY
ncbi:hypothetical protein [Microbulbifer sp. TYP-18]|uniref:hypothetical protein n=1 Tax=Microbulbifer sp. TYP-18 TaxID=3230024 RepID=UPI0034C6C279